MRPPSISTSTQNDALSSSKGQTAPAVVTIKKSVSTLSNDGSVISKIDQNFYKNGEVNLLDSGSVFCNNKKNDNQYACKSAVIKSTNRALPFSTSFSSVSSSASTASPTIASIKRISSDLDKYNTISKSNEKVPLLINKKISSRKKDSIVEVLRSEKNKESHTTENVVASVVYRHLKPNSDCYNLTKDNVGCGGSVVSVGGGGGGGDYSKKSRLCSENRRSLQLPFDFKISNDKEESTLSNQIKRRQQIHSWYASEYETLIEELENESKVILFHFNMSVYIVNNVFVYNFFHKMWVLL